MTQGISEILTFAVGVAISPVPIIAVTLMLFSQRARINGPAFLVGWVVALAVVSGAVYTLADQADAATDSTTGDAIAWGKIVFGVLFLLLAARNWRHRPAPGAQPEMPKWMAGIDALKPGKALGLGVLLAGVNPKNLMLAAAAGAKARLDEMKDWLALHNDAVMAVLFLVFGVNLIAKGLPPLT
jgi:Sap, sulfolipid-1-addressing protein